MANWWVVPVAVLAIAGFGWIETAVASARQDRAARAAQVARDIEMLNAKRSQDGRPPVRATPLGPRRGVVLTVEAAVVLLGVWLLLEWVRPAEWMR